MPCGVPVIHQQEWNWESRADMWSSRGSVWFFFVRSSLLRPQRTSVQKDALKTFGQRFQQSVIRLRRHPVVFYLVFETVFLSHFSGSGLLGEWWSGADFADFLLLPVFFRNFRAGEEAPSCEGSSVSVKVRPLHGRKCAQTEPQQSSVVVMVVFVAVCWDNWNIFVVSSCAPLWTTTAL